MKLHKILFAVCICFVSDIAYAQFAPPPSVNMNRDVYSRQVRPVQTPIFHNSNRPRRPRPEIIFTITINKDSTVTSSSGIDYERKINTLQIGIDGKYQMLKPPQTISISCVTDKGKELVGIPADTCWLFKVLLGKLCLYTDRAEEHLRFAAAFQEGDGPVLALTKKNLMPYMKEDEKLVMLLDRGKFAKAVLKYNSINSVK